MSVLDVARTALSSGPLCDPCLGRLFADRSFGLTNAERGNALRVALALEDDDPYEPRDDDGTADEGLAPSGECWVCEGTCERFGDLAERAVRALDDVEFDTYQVGTRVPPLYEENERLLREEAGLAPDAGEQLNREVNREVGRRIGPRLDAEVELGRPDVQVTIDLDADTVEHRINTQSVYGRYRKLERGIPQTEWPCNACGASGRAGAGGPCPECDGTGYRYDDSVEEYVAPDIERALRGTGATFHGAGREDVDARMLGTGRPFVVEVDAPHRRSVDLDAVAEEIDDSADGAVEVEGLRLATYDMVERVKELDASKTYRMAVALDGSVTDDALRRALDELDGATVEQRTPNRVDHRRADRVRTRRVYNIEGELEGDREATIELHGEGGLYVKELVSGDEGRTEPSLAGLLGIGAEVTALDVLAVEGEAEPFADPDFFRE